MPFHRIGWLLAALLVPLFDQGPAYGQMFGARTQGRPLTRQARPGLAGSDAGGLSGNERFLRGNRRPGSFVGTDSRDAQQFVGMGQAGTGRAGLGPLPPPRIQTTPPVSVNQPYPARQKNDLYAPRLEIGFAVTPRDPAVVEETLTERLQQDFARRRFGEIEVSLEGETATLRGTVASANDRDVAAALVLFEPGVASVRNELTILRPPPDPAP